MIETLFTIALSTLFVCSVLAIAASVSAWSSTKQLSEYEGPTDGLRKEPKQ